MVLVLSPSQGSSRRQHWRDEMNAADIQAMEDYEAEQWNQEMAQMLAAEARWVDNGCPTNGYRYDDPESDCIYF